MQAANNQKHNNRQKPLSKADIKAIPPLLLDWYGKNARVLPWRLSPAERYVAQRDLAASKAGKWPNPYHVWLSEIMLQQTVVTTVIPYFENFIRKWPDIHEMGKASEAEVMELWSGLGYYSRARNLAKAAKALSFYIQEKGDWPQSYDEWLALPGIGPYSAAAITAIAFGGNQPVIDGNVVRVMLRLAGDQTMLPAAKANVESLAARLTCAIEADNEGWKYGDYAQALMDLGANICRPKSPNCAACPLFSPCKGKAIAKDLPVRAKKQPKPKRFGTALALIWQAEGQEGDKIFLIRRPSDGGLLAGTLALPSGEWVVGDNNGLKGKNAPPDFTAFPAIGPKNIDHKIIEPKKLHHAGHVRHIFTHFELQLDIWAVRFDGDMARQIPKYFNQESLFLSTDKLDQAGLSSLMKKAALKAFDKTQSL